MLNLRNVVGVSAILYVQTCAAELRRRRKRNLVPDPDIRVHIDPTVCEGCGDCSRQSNCIAVEPLETAFGRKRQINQSACNKDLSCLKGFCPSFVTIRGAEAGGAKINPPNPQGHSVPDAVIAELDRPWNILVTGVGGNGVLTIGALLGMAAHLDGKVPMIMDMAGLAQKGGAVSSHIRIGRHADAVRAPRIAAGKTDLLLAADPVVTAAPENLSLCEPTTTAAVVNTDTQPVSEFTRERDFDFQTSGVLQRVRGNIASDAEVHRFADIARRHFGDEVFTNPIMLGFAWQKGWIPLRREAIEQAVQLNGVAVDSNLGAFHFGRQLAHDPTLLNKASAQVHDKPSVQSSMSLGEVLKSRQVHLHQYQNMALAHRYVAAIDAFRDRITDHDAGDKLARTAALNYAKLLAYKDEYEVARLFSRREFVDGLKAKYGARARYSFNFAPPLLNGTDANGRPRKREFSAAIVPALRCLAQMRWLRGTWLDPFGHTEERRIERKLISYYEADMALVGQRISPNTYNFSLDLLQAPDAIRGFGPVKLAAVKEYVVRREHLRSAITGTDDAAQLVA
jgi:indolepyruvate ferredoxin oxidoreductase